VVLTLCRPKDMAAMYAFKEFDQLLRGGGLDDWWGDDGVLVGAELLGQFSGDDWQTLGKQWSSQPDGWIARCADVLGNAEFDKACPILLAMLETLETRDVLLAAAGSMNALVGKFRQGEPVPVNIEVRKKLLQMADNEGIVTRMVIGDLLAEDLGG